MDKTVWSCGLGKKRMISRRQVVIALGAGALAPFAYLAPLASFAQPRKVWRIGFLLAFEPSYYTLWIDAFKAGMSALGYAEGRDYVIELRSYHSDSARLPALAAELVALKIDMIVSTSTGSALAASKATREIPILTTNAGDPVGNGLAASLRRPGGNVTGLTSLSAELYTKRLDLLRQLLPRMRRVGFLYNPDPKSQIDALNLARFEADCGKLQLQPIRAPARNAEEIASAFKILARDKVQGLIVTTGSTNSNSQARIIELAAKQRLPAVYARRDWAEAGGLLSYAPDYSDLWRRAAAYADKIFKGAKPGDLPIQQPTLFEFVLNMKTAKALGLKIPGSILVQATRVIE